MPSIRIKEKLEKEIKNLSLGMQNAAEKEKKSNSIKLYAMKKNFYGELFAKVITAFHIRETFSV